jgi:hypothetical protein
MLLAEDQRPVEYLAAQRADEALADRIHPRRQDGAHQDSGASCLKHGVERGGEVRPAVSDQEPDVLEPLVHAEGEARFRACCTVHSPVGLAVTPPRCIRPGPGHAQPEADLGVGQALARLQAGLPQPGGAEDRRAAHLVDQAPGAVLAVAGADPRHLGGLDAERGGDGLALEAAAFGERADDQVPHLLKAE